MPKGRDRKLFGYEEGDMDVPSLWDLLGIRAPTGQTYGPAGQPASDVMMPGEYFDSTYTHWSDPKLRDWPKGETLEWFDYDAPVSLDKKPIYDETKEKPWNYLPIGWQDWDHGAVPENVKQSMLSDMLDYYGNVNMQHQLVPEEYAVSGPGGKVVSDARYVPAPSAVDMGDQGPDYTTMMSIMKAQEDPDFDIGFMSEDYMVNKPRTGAYYQSSGKDIALNPYKTMDFSDPIVDKAFSQGAGKPRTLTDLTEDTKLNLQYDPDWSYESKPKYKDYDNYDDYEKDWDDWFVGFKDRRDVDDTREDIAHELGGHYGTEYGRWNRGDKFHMPRDTQFTNLTNLHSGAVTDVPGHNEAYWLGRRHDPWWWKTDRDTGEPRQGNMNLTHDAAENLRDWRADAKQYVANRDQPRSVADYTPRAGASNFGTPNFAPSHTTPSRPRNPNNPHQGFNQGGIAGLPGQWIPSMSESEEEEYDIRPLQLDPGIMSIEDLEDLFEEAGLDKSIIYKLINTGGLSQFVV